MRKKEGRAPARRRRRDVLGDDQASEDLEEPLDLAALRESLMEQVHELEADRFRLKAMRHEKLHSSTCMDLFDEIRGELVIATKLTLQLANELLGETNEKPLRDKPSAARSLRLIRQATGVDVL